MFCVYKPKAPFKPVLEVATTREDSEVGLVHDPEAEHRIAIGLRPLDMGWRLIRVPGGDGGGSNDTVNTEILC